jgi:hypothetical protein
VSTQPFKAVLARWEDAARYAVGAIREGVPREELDTLFPGLLGGMTRPESTDSYGKALIEHSSTGTADVYVNGKKYTSFHAPGETAVTI